jgi:putative flippase GtrA
MFVLREVVSRDFARFAALSGGGWLLDAGLLLALVGLAGVAPQVANLFSASCAATFVYLVSHRRIHSGQREGLQLRLGAYLVYTAVLILAASWAMAPLTAFAAHLTGPGIAAAFIAKCLVTPPQLLCNFLVSRAVARASLGRHDG